MPESTHGMNDNIDGREFFVIYMDNAATTRLSGRALEAMMPYLTEQYANPAGTYSFTHASNAAMEKARKQVADVIGATSAEIFFTSGGTESDNWALKGTMRANEKKGRHLIISAIEHHAILHSAKALEREGFEVTVLPVDADGVVAPEAVEAAIRPDTVLVSIMAANNEIGTIQPIKQIAELAHSVGAKFHTDAVQAVGHMHIDVQEMGIDMLSLSGHKFRGPRGTGVLYVKKGITLEPLVYGGGQERGLVSGTENTAGCIGLAAAMKEAVEGLDEKMGYVKKLTDKLVKGIMENIPYSHYTGDPVNRLPGTASFVFEAIEGEGLILRLDNAGVCGSTGSACSTGSLDPSHVLMAIGLPHEIAHGSLRLTLGEQNTEEDVDYIIETVTDVVKTLRSMSPVWENGHPNLTAATELHAH